MRVVLFTTALCTKSKDPQVSLLVTIILVGGLLTLKNAGVTVYKSLFVDAVDTILNFNLLALSAFSFYYFKADVKKLQTAVVHISTIITLILLVKAIIYHVFLLVRKEKRPKEEDEVVVIPIQTANAEITHSVIEIPKPRDESSSLQANSNEAEITY